MESGFAPKNPLKKDLPELVESLRGRVNELVVCLSHSWGGLEQVAAADAIDRGALGLPVQVMCLEGTPIHESLAHRKEVSVIPLNFRPRDYFDFKLKSELLHLFGQGVNLIHTHQTSILGSITPWLWSRPQIAAFASRHIMNNHNKRNFFHRAIYSRLDGLLVMSQTLRQNVIDTHPLRERMVKVVNLGLNFEVFDPNRVDPSRQRAAWGADSETIVIGLVGRIDPAKGQSTFIKAAAGLIKALGPGRKLKFVMVGEETLGRASNHLEELKAMVAQFRIEDSVLFAGYQENIPEVMRSFDILVMPSRQEAFGLVAIEAMAMECPIVISRGGSAAEIVGEEEFGLLIRPEDAFDLQRQLKTLVDQPEMRLTMGRKARSHVKANYDRRVRIHRTLDLYERALRRRKILSET